MWHQGQLVPEPWAEVLSRKDTQLRGGPVPEEEGVGGGQAKLSQRVNGVSKWLQGVGLFTSMGNSCCP